MTEVNVLGPVYTFLCVKHNKVTLLVTDPIPSGTTTVKTKVFF